MKKTLIAFAFIAIGIIANAQPIITSGEYWFNNDYANKTTMPVNPGLSVLFNSGVDCSQLNPGMHNINFRFEQSNGIWSAVGSQLFMKVPELIPGGAAICAMEYWLDNDYSSRISQPVASTSLYTYESLIDLNSLSVGFHNFNFRFKQSNGIWSGVSSQIFLKVPELTPGGAAISVMEYWLDNDYSSRISQPVASTSLYTYESLIDLNSLSGGMHNFNFRFKQNSGSWSSVTSQLFYKVPPITIGNNQLICYEYWIDDDYQSKITQQITGTGSFILISDLNLAVVPEGMHQINFRFKQSDGSWSSALSEAFVKLPMGFVSRSITAYEYWFDDDYNQRVVEQIEPVINFVFVAPLNVTDLSTGLHNLNMRFKQDDGKWSSAISQLFMKRPVDYGNNVISTYEHWFNDDFENRTITNGINEEQYTTNSLINIENPDQFINVFHARFKDLNNAYTYVDHFFYSINLQMTFMLEGLYSQASGQMRKCQNESGDNFGGNIADVVTIEIYEAMAPYNLLVSFSEIEVNTDGTCLLQRSGTDFINLPGTQNSMFHLVVKHRNSIETWSQAFEIGPVNTFDFTDSPQKAYGGNMRNSNGTYLFYAGDVNQDGTIDTSDMTPVDNGASSFATGYLTTDVNGDGVVDTGDMTIVDNNAAGFVGAVTP